MNPIKSFKKFLIFLPFIIVEFNFWKANAANKLVPLNVDVNSVTISGFSSGGAQAMQFHFSYSSKILGAGIFSGVPYMYGHDRKREDFFVTDPDSFNITIATEYAKKYEQEGLIDPLANLNKSRVYIYHGTKDSTVYHGSGKSIEKIYEYFNPSIYAHLDALPSEHGMPSNNSGGPCGLINLHLYLVNNCGYSGVYEMFDYLYGGNLLKPNGTVGTVSLNGNFSSFDQSEYFEKGEGLFHKTASMDDQGFLYIPSGCLQNYSEKSCKLAIALHGCAQSRQMYGDKFAKTTGYLEMAELNDIIVIFPQTKPSIFNPRNPSGCWDWMGFTGKNNYATQNGLQIKVLSKMLNRVLGKRVF